MFGVCFKISFGNIHFKNDYIILLDTINGILIHASSAHFHLRVFYLKEYVRRFPLEVF